MTTNLATELAVRAFEEGFAIGADPRKRSAGRHVVDAETHQHWRAGFEAGRAAVEEYSTKYREAIR